MRKKLLLLVAIGCISAAEPDFTFAYSFWREDTAAAVSAWTIKNAASSPRPARCDTFTIFSSAADTYTLSESTATTTTAITSNTSAQATSNLGGGQATTITGYHTSNATIGATIWKFDVPSTTAAFPVTFDCSSIYLRNASQEITLKSTGTTGTRRIFWKWRQR